LIRQQKQIQGAILSFSCDRILTIFKSSTTFFEIDGGLRDSDLHPIMNDDAPAGVAKVTL